MEDGNASGLPTKEDQEFRPFVRRLPEFKFWYSTTKAIAIGFFCSWFEIFNLPVFWPVLVVYWLILFGLTSMSPLPFGTNTRIHVYAILGSRTTTLILSAQCDDKFNT